METMAKREVDIAGQADSLANIEREEREAILRDLEEETRHVAALPAPRRSVVELCQGVFILAFAAVVGVLCGVAAVLVNVIMRILLG